MIIEKVQGRLDPPTEYGIVWPKEQRLPDQKREISGDEARCRELHDSYGIKGLGYDQLFVDWNGQGKWEGDLWNVNVHFYSDWALAICKIYCSGKRWNELGEQHRSGEWVEERSYEKEPYFENKYGFAVRYFLLGCEHHFEEWADPKRMDKFDHSYRCTKCGYSYMVNSSD